MSGRLLLNRSASRIFLREVGITADPFEELDEFLLQCEQANPRYRGGQDLVRFQLKEDHTQWKPKEYDAIMNMAGSFGMLGGDEKPFNKEVKVVVPTAGARRSTLQRAMHAVQAIVEGRAAAKLIVIAGSTRPLIPSEIPFVADYAEGGENATTEYHCCIGARTKILERYPDLDIITVCRDDPKSGTEGIIEEVMKHERVRQLGEVIDTAWITTRIYYEGLCQKLAIAKTKYPAGCTFFGVGHASDPEIIWERKPATYLSEGLTTCRNAAIAASMGV